MATINGTEDGALDFMQTTDTNDSASASELTSDDSITISIKSPTTTSNFIPINSEVLASGYSVSSITIGDAIISSSDNNSSSDDSQNSNVLWTSNSFNLEYTPTTNQVDSPRDGSYIIDNLSSVLETLSEIGFVQDKEIIDSTYINKPLISGNNEVINIYYDINGTKFNKDYLFYNSKTYTYYGLACTYDIYETDSYGNISDDIISVNDIQQFPEKVNIWKLKQDLTTSTYYTYLFYNPTTQSYSYNEYYGKVKWNNNVPLGIDVPYYTDIKTISEIDYENTTISTYDVSYRGVFDKTNIGDIILKTLTFDEKIVFTKKDKTITCSYNGDALDGNILTIGSYKININDWDNIEQNLKNAVSQYSLYLASNIVSEDSETTTENFSQVQIEYIILKPITFYIPTLVYTNQSGNAYYYIPYEVNEHVQPDKPISVEYNVNSYQCYLGIGDTYFTLSKDNTYEYNGETWYCSENNIENNIENLKFYFKHYSVDQDDDKNYIETEVLPEYVNNELKNNIGTNDVFDILVFSNDKWEDGSKDDNIIISHEYRHHIGIGDSSTYLFSYTKLTPNEVTEVSLNMKYSDYVGVMTAFNKLEYIDTITYKYSYVVTDKTQQKYGVSVLYPQTRNSISYSYWSPVVNSYVEYNGYNILKYNNSFYGTDAKSDEKIEKDSESYYTYHYNLFLRDIYERTYIYYDGKEYNYNLDTISNSSNYVKGNSEYQVNTYSTVPFELSNSITYEFNNNYEYVPPQSSYVINITKTNTALSFSDVGNTFTYSQSIYYTKSNVLVDKLLTTKSSLPGGAEYNTFIYNANEDETYVSITLNEDENVYSFINKVDNLSEYSISYLKQNTFYNSTNGYLYSTYNFSLTLFKKPSSTTTDDDNNKTTVENNTHYELQNFYYCAPSSIFGNYWTKNYNIGDDISTDNYGNNVIITNAVPNYPIIYAFNGWLNYLYNTYTYFITTDQLIIGYHTCSLSNIDIDPNNLYSSYSSYKISSTISSDGNYSYKINNTTYYTNKCLTNTVQGLKKTKGYSYSQSKVISQDGYWKKQYDKKTNPFITVSYSYSINGLNIDNANIIPGIKDDVLGTIKQHKITYNKISYSYNEEFVFTYYDDYNIQKKFEEDTYHIIVNDTTGKNIGLESLHYYEEIYYDNNTFYSSYENTEDENGNPDIIYSGEVTNTNEIYYQIEGETSYLKYGDGISEDNKNKNIKYYSHSSSTNIKLLNKRKIVTPTSYIEEVVLQNDDILPITAKYEAPFGVVNGKQVNITSVQYIPETYTTITTIDPITYRYSSQVVKSTEAYYAYTYELEDVPLKTSAYLFTNDGITINGLDNLINAVANITGLSYGYINSNGYTSSALSSLYDSIYKQQSYFKNFDSYMSTIGSYLLKLNSAIDTNSYKVSYSISNIKIPENKSQNIGGYLTTAYTALIKANSTDTSNFINAQKSMFEKLTTSINNQSVALNKLVVSNIINSSAYEAGIDYTSLIYTEVPQNWSEVEELGFKYTYQKLAYTYSTSSIANSKASNKTLVKSSYKTVTGIKYYDTYSYVQLSYTDYKPTTISPYERIALHLNKETHNFVENGYIYKETKYSYQNIADVLADLHISQRQPTKNEFIIDVAKSLYINSDFMFGYTSANEYAIRAIRRAYVLWTELINANVIDTTSDYVKPTIGMNMNVDLSDFKTTIENKTVGQSLTLASQYSEMASDSTSDLLKKDTLILKKSINEANLNLLK
jgi:hypothetical protein